MPHTQSLSRRAMLRMAVLTGLSLSPCLTPTGPSATPQSLTTATGTVPVPNRKPPAKRILAGYTFSACRKGDKLYTWGMNRESQLGDGTTKDHMTPVEALLPADVIDMAAGGLSCFALRDNGTVWAWGASFEGALADDTFDDRSMPAQISDLSNVVSVSAAVGRAAALTGTGEVWAWGVLSGNEILDEVVEVVGVDPDDIHMNHPGPTFVVKPYRVPLSDIATINVGDTHTLALTSDKTVWAWGDNHVGQLGDGTFERNLNPVQVIGLGEITAIAGGDGFSVALKNDGTVWTWGGGVEVNVSGQLLQLQGLHDVIAIDAGSKHMLALHSNGTVSALGRNVYGQLGVGSTTDRTIPVKVYGLTEVLEISAGVDHSLALQSDGTVWAWGTNFAGQLGDGTKEDKHIPVQVSGINLFN